MPDLDDLLAELTALNASVAALVENTAFKRAQLDDKVAEAEAARDAAAAHEAGAGTAGAAAGAAVAALVGPAPYCAYSGTPSAVVLTSPSGNLTPITGLKVRFRATAQNGGATTIALDGGAAIACRNVRGTALPAGYIRTDFDTEATFDGTYWVVGRPDESGGSLGTGFYTRHADGRLTMRHKLTTSASASVTWTFPIPFTSDSPVTIYASTGAAAVTASASLPDNLTASVNAYNTSAARVAASVHVRAEGFWY